MSWTQKVQERKIDAPGFETAVRPCLSSIKSALYDDNIQQMEESVYS